MQQKPSAPNSSPSLANKDNYKHLDLPDLPEFESLPATAGLTNVEAFWLSIRHALALLPAVVAKRDNFAAAPNPERFSLR
jgi:hypothetical protein